MTHTAARVINIAHESRSRDDRDTVRERLKVFAEATRPLLDHYGQQGLLAQVDGVGSTDEVEKRILSAVNGVAPPPK